VLSFLARDLLLPPIDILIATIIFWLLSWRYPRAGHWGVGAGLLVLWLLAAPVTSNLLFAGLESGMQLAQPDSPALQGAMPAAIVILSGDSGFGAPAGAIVIGARPGGLSLERVRAGAILYRRTKLPILVTGGVLRPDEEPIADLLAQALRDDFATPVRWVEPKSADTWENAEFSAAILARNGIKSVYVVTHPWHMRRALIAFAHFGITAWPAPTDLDVFRKLAPSDFMPSTEGWLNSYFALHEWVGCAVYALHS
jgi:uncharacterized SAM-binding protein YcdF (DUF218 family)